MTGGEGRFLGKPQQQPGSCPCVRLPHCLFTASAGTPGIAPTHEHAAVNTDCSHLDLGAPRVRLLQLCGPRSVDGAGVEPRGPERGPTC